MNSSDSILPPKKHSVNSVIQGNCLDVFAKMKSDTIDLTVFSPPYDSIRDYKDHRNFDSTEVGRELYRLTKESGICAVVIGDGTKDFAKSLTTFRWAVDWCDNAG